MSPANFLRDTKSHLDEKVKSVRGLGVTLDYTITVD